MKQISGELLIWYNERDSYHALHATRIKRSWLDQVYNETQARQSYQSVLEVAIRDAIALSQDPSVVFED